MNKTFCIFIIIALLVIDIFTLIYFHNFKQRSARTTKYLLSQNVIDPDELHSYRVNFISDIENSNIKLENIDLKDSLNEISPLINVFQDGQKQILVCRFSQMNCESCVNFSIQTLRHWVDSIGKTNVLFLGAYRNNKIFNKQKPLYGIHELNVANTPLLNLPAEEIGYPYYFVLDSELRVSNLFIPDKAVPQMSKNYLKRIHERYFK